MELSLMNIGLILFFTLGTGILVWFCLEILELQDNSVWNVWVIRHRTTKLLLSDYEEEGVEFVATHFDTDPLKFVSEEAALTFLQRTKIFDSNEVVLYDQA